MIQVCSAHWQADVAFQEGACCRERVSRLLRAGLYASPLQPLESPKMSRPEDQPKRQHGNEYLAYRPYNKRA